MGFVEHDYSVIIVSLRPPNPQKEIERKYINPVCYDHDAMDKWSAYCPFRLESVSRKLEDEDAPEFINKVVERMYELLNTVGIKGTANWFRDNKISFRNESYDVCVYKLIEGKRPSLVPALFPLSC